GWGWTSFSDEVKTQNIVANGHLTSAAMATWTFGTIQQRFLPSTWRWMYSQTITEISGEPAFLLVPGIALLLFARHRITLFLMSIVGFLLPFLIFTNLHVVHDHYAYANGVFLIAAVSWCVVGLLEGSAWKQNLALILLFVCMVSATRAYSHRLYRYQQVSFMAFGTLVPAIKESTRPTDV